MPRIVIYILLLLLRIAAQWYLPGYIHPDEYFQSGQELWFGCPPKIPWEYHPTNALRSILPPTIMTYLPIRLYSFLMSSSSLPSLTSLSGREILIIPRLACCLLSILVVDWSVWKLSYNGSTDGVPIPVLLLASSWPTFVMLSRPFSNSLESMVLALLLRTIISKIDTNTAVTNITTSYSLLFALQVGMICSVGIFTRFTFAFFAIPVLLFFLYNMIQQQKQKQKQQSVKSKSFLLPTITLFWMTISFLFVSAVIIFADTQFYNNNNKNNNTQGDGISSFLSSLVFTPFNALRYNSQVSNLKDHGLHPRWTHAGVNMFILFGPLTIIAYMSILSSSPFPSPKTTTTTTNGNNDK